VTKANGEAGAVVDTEDGEPVLQKPARRKPSSAEAKATAAEARAKAAAHLEALETRPAASKPIVIPKLDIRTMRVRLVGDAPLIVHRFSEKAKKMMLDKQMGIASEGRAFKNPEEDFRDSLYTIPGGKHGFPAIGFKNAAVTACTSLGKSISKVAARQAFHVVGDMVEIRGTPTMREDTVRIGQGTADIRYRGEFREWSCELTVRYNARVLSDEQIINLLNVAGFAVGIGEWRPERDGQFGLFHVE
jgi:hypothetical protein